MFKSFLLLLLLSFSLNTPNNILFAQENNETEENTEAESSNEIEDQGDAHRETHMKAQVAQIITYCNYYGKRGTACEATSSSIRSKKFNTPGECRKQCSPGLFR